MLRRVLWYRERLLGGGFRAAEALETHELHERTFHRDIAYLRTLDWDLHFCRSEPKDADGRARAAAGGPVDVPGRRRRTARVTMFPKPRHGGVAWT